MSSHDSDESDIEYAGDCASPQEDLERAEFPGELAEAIRSLPEREKLVLSLYYDDELNLREIGEVLDVSESRVCQIHGQALTRLRARLDSRSGARAAT